MISNWIDRAKKWPRLPGRIEGWQVRTGRARLCRIAENGAQEGVPRRLLVDISVIFRHDAGTGIQRVVRAIYTQLQNRAGEDFLIQPVMATRKHPYRLVTWPPVDDGEQEKLWVPNAGDIFLGLDLCAHIIPPHLEQLSRWKAQGVRFYFMLYDLLPLHHPEWFSAKLVRAFRRWIKSLAILGDGVFCISELVEQDFQHWLKHRYGLGELQGIRTVRVPMGGHIAESMPSQGIADGFEEMLTKIRSAPAALVVGTIEPRKGHQQILDAFEHLWRQGHAYNLVIVGRPGWKTEALQRKIRCHTRKDLQIFWFEGASDEALNILYETCSGVLIASHSEGYGLPLLEALHFGKPILARDSEIFRQHKSPLVRFFDAQEVASLAARIHEWFISIDDLTAFDGSGQGDFKLPTWSDAANAVLCELRQKHHAAAEE